MDPLSSTKKDSRLLDICLDVRKSLTVFYDHASFANTEIEGLITDVESFTEVLREIKENLEHPEVQRSLQSSGHVGTLGRDVLKIIGDGQRTLSKLKITLDTVTNNVAVLNGVQKQLRLQSASEQIGTLQRQVRKSRDKLQLSLQNLASVNQTSLQSSTDRILRDDETFMLFTEKTNLSSNPSEQTSNTLLLAPEDSYREQPMSASKSQTKFETYNLLNSPESKFLGYTSSTSTLVPSALQDTELERPTSSSEMKNNNFVAKHCIFSCICVLWSAAQSPSRNPIVRRKLVMVGEGDCGKTSLFNVFRGKGFLKDNYLGRPWFDSDTIVLNSGRYTTELELHDTAGLEDYDHLRPLCYPDTHVFLLCFSIGMPDSLEKVYLKWKSEIEQYGGRVPIILVGLKKDLHYNPNTIKDLAKYNKRTVTAKQGEEMRRAIQAYKYFECSAKTGEGVQELLEAVVGAAMLPLDKKRKKSLLKAFGRASS